MTAAAPEHATVYFANDWPALQTRRQQLGEKAPLIVCLCAEWCAVCRDFKPAYRTLAQEHPESAFAYLDIEDDEAFIGTLELDDFPTLAVFRGDALVHFGVVKARRDSIVRLLRTLESSPPLAPTAALRTLCAAVAGKTTPA